MRMLEELGVMEGTVFVGVTHPYWEGGINTINMDHHHHHPLLLGAAMHRIGITLRVTITIIMRPLLCKPTRGGHLLPLGRQRKDIPRGVVMLMAVEVQALAQGTLDITAVLEERV